MHQRRKSPKEGARRSRARGKVLTDNGLLKPPIFLPGQEASVSLAAPASARSGEVVGLPRQSAITAQSSGSEAEILVKIPIVGQDSHPPPASVLSLRPRAEQIVNDFAPLAIGAAVIPLPGLDLIAIGGLQLKLLAALAELYKVPFTPAQAQLIVTSLLGSVGVTFLSGAVLASTAKFVPFFGALLSSASLPVAGGAITRAMGHLAIDHFDSGGTMETFDLDLAQDAFLAKIGRARGV